MCPLGSEVQSGRAYPSWVERFRVAAAQLNAVVGDLDGNVERIRAAYETACRAEADLVVFPELMLTGYPPEDLLLRPGFLAAARNSLEKIASKTQRLPMVVGFPDLEKLPDVGGLPDRAEGGRLFNAAAVCASGKVIGVYRKHLLPNYSVFDEKRYFTASTTDGPLFLVNGVRVAVTICEDIWSETGPVVSQAQAGAQLIVNINASPYYAGRLAERQTMLENRARQAGVPIVYVNMVGGQDELVFDGASLACDAEGTLVARARQFIEDLLVADVEVSQDEVSFVTLPELVASTIDPGGGSMISLRQSYLAPTLDPDREVYEALVLGTRDYIDKNGFAETVIGLSGGVDSSLVAAIAVDALGPERVVGVLMPSRFSSEGSLADAQLLSENLGIRSFTVPIEPAHRATLEMLADPFAGAAGADGGLAEENIQARIRGVILMALSNKFGWLVLTTGNKSEMAVGYATLYGDMAGGFAVIKDVDKTLVYRLARDRNERAGHDLIPSSVLDKAPSAELRPDQEDEDSLPPYDLLDQIIEGYVEQDRSIQDLVASGMDPQLTREVARMVDRSEYKRRQAPPGIRVTKKAFGKDRRLPITNRWTEG